MAIETPRAQKRGVEDIRTVGCRDNDNAVVHLKAVHLNEELIKRLLALIVTATKAGATVTTDGVDLVDENNTGSLLLGLVEHVANTRCAYTDEHFHEV